MQMTNERDLPRRSAPKHWKKSFCLAISFQLLLVCLAGWVVVMRPSRRISAPTELKILQSSSRQENVVLSNRWCSDLQSELVESTWDQFNVSAQFPTTSLINHCVSTSPNHAVSGIALGGFFASVNPFASGTLEAIGRKQAFLGQEIELSRVVIAFDVSQSVKTKADRQGFPLERIRDEACRLINSFDGRQAFALIQFSRKYESYQGSLRPANRSNREAAAQWLRAHFVTDGMSRQSWKGGQPDGIELILEQAFSCKPDQILIISDGDFQRTGTAMQVSFEDLRVSLERLRSTHGCQPEIQFVCIGLTEKKRRQWTAFCNQNALKFSEL
jgi:hypothetical protein